MRNTRTQQRRPALELRLDIFLDLSGVPQGRVPRGRSIEPQRRSHQVSERRALLLTSWPVAFFVAMPGYESLAGTLAEV